MATYSQNEIVKLMFVSKMISDDERLLTISSSLSISCYSNISYKYEPIFAAQSNNLVLFSLYPFFSEHMKKQSLNIESALAVLCGRLMIAVGDRRRISIATCIRTTGRTGLGPMTSPEIDQRSSSRFVLWCSST